MNRDNKRVFFIIRIKYLKILLFSRIFRFSKDDFFFIIRIHKS